MIMYGLCLIPVFCNHIRFELSVPLYIYSQCRQTTILESFIWTNPAKRRMYGGVTQAKNKNKIILCGPQHKCSPKKFSGTWFWLNGIQNLMGGWNHQEALAPDHCLRLLTPGDLRRIWPVRDNREEWFIRCRNLLAYRTSQCTVMKPTVRLGCMGPTL